MSLKQRTIRGLSWAFIDRFANQLSQFIFGIILARLLSPAEYGLIGMLETRHNVRVAKDNDWRNFQDEITEYRQMRKETTLSLNEAVRRATGGAGVHVAYDGVGKDTFDASLASLRPRGMLAR